MISQELEREILAQEELIAKVLKARSSDRPKKFWERAGVVPAATAILTVVVTSVASYFTQKALRDNDNRITVVRENTKLGRDAVGSANTAIAGVLKLNEERTLAVTGEFASLDSLQLSAITRNANRLQEEWRQRREDVEMELFLAFDSSAAILDAWHATRAALDSQVACIERAYDRVLAMKRYVAKPVCNPEETASRRNVAALRNRLSHEYRRLKTGE